MVIKYLNFSHQISSQNDKSLLWSLYHINPEHDLANLSVNKVTMFVVVNLCIVGSGLQPEAHSNRKVK